MSLIAALKARLDREAFFPGVLSFFLSPYFITRHHLVKAIRELAPRIGGAVLDFGCGSKPYESLFAHAERYVGVDVEVSGHDHSTSRVDYFYEGNRLPFDDATFDSIVSFEVFEHVAELEVMVAELARVARPGANLLVTTPFVFPEHEVPFDFRRLTRYGLQDILEGNGFEIILFRPTTGSILAVAQLFNHVVFREISPNFTLARILAHFLLALPATILAYLLHFLLPGRSSLYVNSAILARKRGAAEAA
jgi:SAM-dependent methyltransferase